MRTITLLITVLVLTGCATTSLLLEPNGRISMTKETGFSADAEELVGEMKEAMVSACGGGKRLELATMNGGMAPFAGPENLEDWLELVERVKGLLGKTTVTLAGSCKRGGLVEVLGGECGDWEVITTGASQGKSGERRVGTWKHSGKVVEIPNEMRPDYREHMKCVVDL